MYVVLAYHFMGFVAVSARNCASQMTVEQEYSQLKLPVHAGYE